MDKLKEWDENVGITWWKEGRTQLNKVIRKYNKWVDKHSDNKVKTAKLLGRINEALEKHYCNQSGGSGWKNELLEMKSAVKSVSCDNCNNTSYIIAENGDVGEDCEKCN